MNEPKDPEAAETVQTASDQAVVLPRFVAPEIYPCRHCGGTPEWAGKLTHKCLTRAWSLIGEKAECFRDWNEVHGRAPISGWLYVKCDICGDTWRETSRDIKAVSSVECANGCEHGGDTHVWKREQCFLPVDRSGNLREYTKERLTAGSARFSMENPIDPDDPIYFHDTHQGIDMIHDQADEQTERASLELFLTGPLELKLFYSEI